MARPLQNGDFIKRESMMISGIERIFISRYWKTCCGKINYKSELKEYYSSLDDF